MQTLLEILNKTASFLENKGVESARLNAELLLAHVLQCKRLDLYLQFERPLTEQVLKPLRSLVKRRGQREPLQYILGDAAFCDLILKVSPCVLIPRPETEALVEQVTARFESEPSRILDLGTGSGAIALSLAQAFPQSAVIAVDFSEDALIVARENAVLNRLEERVQFIQSDWFDRLKAEEPFDLIVSNPPYLTEEEWELAEPEVKQFEPKTALTAQEEGLSDLRLIIEEARSYLNKNGAIALETGINHHQPLTDIAKHLNYDQIESIEDVHGRSRFFFCRKN